MSVKGIIGVIGSGEEDSLLNEYAREVGALIAGAGYALINGGLDGVMKSSAQGAKEAGGLTIGLLPGSDKKAANPYVEVVIPTGMGDMRNALIVRASLGIIAIGGGAGTLSEVAMALKAERPIVGLKSLNSTLVSMDIPDKFLEAKDPEDALAKLLVLLSSDASTLRVPSAEDIDKC